MKSQVGEAKFLNNQKQIPTNQLFKILSAGIGLSICLSSCTIISGNFSPVVKQVRESSDSSQNEPSNSNFKKVGEDKKSTEIIDHFTILSAGDVLLHGSVNEAARIAARSTNTNQAYDYAPLFQGFKAWSAGADLALCTLEVPISPNENYTDYPLFGAPAEVVKGLKDNGWDGCATATNHSMDRRFAGVESTVTTFQTQKIGWTGTATNPKQAEPQFYELTRGGRVIRVAHLSATTVTNGLHWPADKPWAWNVVGKLGWKQPADLVADARRARQAGADLVVLSMHWGVEYRTEPTQEQREIAQELANSGQIDIIFGDHPHVPEPIEKLPGGVDNRGMWVIWSMGNFISGQLEENHGVLVTTGAAAIAHIDVPRQGKPYVNKLTWTPVTHFEDSTYHVWTIPDLRNQPEPLYSPQQLEKRYKALLEVMGGEQYLQLQAPQPTGSAAQVVQR